MNSAQRGTGVSPGDGRLPKTLRLRRRKEFLRVQRSGVKVSSQPLLALALESPCGVTRVGITVSSKVGNAVLRNRIRRCLREIFRTRRAYLPGGIDVVLIATSRSADADFATLRRAYDSLASKLKRYFP